MKKIIIVAVIMGFFVGGQADEIILDVGSIHTKEYSHIAQDTHRKMDVYNNENFGIGYLKTLNEYINFGGGGYWNSYKKPSFYIGAEALYPVSDVFKIGIAGAVVTGYKNKRVDYWVGDPETGHVETDITNKDQYKPVFLPAIEAQYKISETVDLAVEFTDTELVQKNGVGVFHFQLRFKI